MARYTKTSLGSNYASKQQIDTNLDDIKTAIDDTLSRKGDSPNAMEADLDMNSNRILNLPNAINPAEPVTLAQFNANSGGTKTTSTLRQLHTATAGQTVFTTPEYVIGSNNLAVYINGVRQNSEAYSETTTTSITLSEGAELGDKVEVLVNELQESTDQVGATNVTYDGTTVGVVLDALIVDTVAAAKALDLQVGKKVKTWGYTTAGDGGGAEYQVVAAGTGTDDGGSYHDMTNGNQLELVSEGLVNVRAFGASPSAAASDNSTAFQAALDFGNVFVPSGTYDIDAALVMTSSSKTLAGESISNTRIQQTTANTPVLQVGGSFNIVENISLNFSPSQAYTNGSAICLNLVDANFNSSFKNLRLTNGAYGVKLTTKDTAAANLFSCTFNNLYIFGPSFSGMDIQSVAGGSTGNDFGNIYINFKRSGVAQNAERGVFFSAVNESVFNQLNIEWGKLPQAIQVNGGETLQINTLHLEGMEPMNGINGTGATGFIAGTQDTISVNSMSIINSTFDDANISTYPVVYSASGMKCTINGLVTRDNTKTGSPNFRYYSNDSDANKGYLNLWNLDNDGGQINEAISNQLIRKYGYENTASVMAGAMASVSGTPSLTTCGGSRQSCWSFADAASDTISGTIPEIVRYWEKFNVYALCTQNTAGAGAVRLSFVYETYDETDALNSSGSSNTVDHTVANVQHELDKVLLTTTSLTMDEKDLQSFRLQRAGSHANDTLAQSYEVVALIFERAQ